MILVESKLGNLNEPLWHRRAHECVVDHLALEQWEAPKSRLRKASEGGVELAISLPRDEHLQDGDVLFYDEAQRLLVVARIALREVLVIELDGLDRLAPDEILRAAFELGHALGNQHWPAVIKGSTVYVPLSVDRKVMDSVMRTHAFKHIRTYFAPGEEVAAKLDAREVRLLFAGADATPHDHHHGTNGHDHPRQHGRHRTIHDRPAGQSVS